MAEKVLKTSIVFTGQPAVSSENLMEDSCGKISSNDYNVPVKVTASDHQVDSSELNSPQGKTLV